MLLLNHKYLHLSAHSCPFIDFHNHSMWNPGDNIIEVISLHGQQQKDCNYYTLGYHPWWTLNLLQPEELSILSESYKHDVNCLGLGEFGLDNLKGADISLQEEIFLQQILVANAVEAPVIIHCVRAFDRMIRLSQTYRKTAWAIHGFVRNKILARQVLDAGMLISVAPNDRMAPSFKEMLEYIPIEKVFIETDSDFSMNIIDRYAIFAEIKKVDVQLIKEHMYTNFINFYKDKWKHHTG